MRKRARESYLFDADLIGFGGIPADLLPNITYLDKNALTKAIRHERRVELGFEFSQVLRFVEVWSHSSRGSIIRNKFFYADHRYSTIPQNEMDTNNPILNH